MNFELKIDNMLSKYRLLLQFNDITCFICSFDRYKSNRVIHEIWHSFLCIICIFCTYWYIHLISILKLTVCFQISIVTPCTISHALSMVSTVIIYIKLINWQGLICVSRLLWLALKGVFWCQNGKARQAQRFTSGSKYQYKGVSRWRRRFCRRYALCGGLPAWRCATGCICAGARGGVLAAFAANTARRCIL
jgi:hypothetical protein